MGSNATPASQRIGFGTRVSLIRTRVARSAVATKARTRVMCTASVRAPLLGARSCVAGSRPSWPLGTDQPAHDQRSREDHREKPDRLYRQDEGDVGVAAVRDRQD